MLKEQPISEQCFFSFTDDKKGEDEKISGLVSFAESIRIIKDISKNDSKNENTRTIISLSTGARDALTQTRYGDHAKFIFPSLGKFTIDKIEKGIRKRGRYSAVDCPTVENQKQFHGVASKFFYLSLHDELHRQLISSIPNPAYEMLLYAIDLVREKTGIKWSKEIWECIDMEVDDFIDVVSDCRDSKSTERLTRNFIMLISANIATEKRLSGLFSPSPFIETIWLLIIDMVVHPDIWSDNGIKREFFPDDSVYAKLYDFVVQNQHIFHEVDSPTE